MRKKTQLQQINLSSKDYKKAKSDWNSDAAKTELIDRMTKGEIKYTSSKGIFSVQLNGETSKFNIKKDVTKNNTKGLIPIHLQQHATKYEYLQKETI